MRLMRSSILAALLAVPCYLLCPATGPVWAGVADAPRNAMPSLHMTWALLCWVYAPRRLRWPSAILVVLTALATVGLGEHFLVDIVAAVPFTAVVVYAERWIWRVVVNIHRKEVPDYAMSHEPAASCN